MNRKIYLGIGDTERETLNLGPSNMFDLIHAFLPTVSGTLEVICSSRPAIVNQRDDVPAIYAGVDATKFIAGRYTTAKGLSVVSSTFVFRDHLHDLASQLNIEITTFESEREIANAVFNRMSVSRNSIEKI